MAAIQDTGKTQQLLIRAHAIFIVVFWLVVLWAFPEARRKHLSFSLFGRNQLILRRSIHGTASSGSTRSLFRC